MAPLSPTAKVALGVSAGYLLGRRKKMRLALTVGSMLAGKKLATNPTALLAQGNKLVDSNPELQKLRDQVTGRMFEAARGAALSTATSRLESMTSNLTGPPGGGGRNDDEDDQYDEGE